MRQRSSHYVLCIDLQYADCLPCASVFSLDCKLCDEAIDAVRQEPGDHDESVILGECSEVGHQARGCMEHTHVHTHTRKCKNTSTYNTCRFEDRTLKKKGCVCLYMDTYGTQQSLCTKICWMLQCRLRIWLLPTERNRHTIYKQWQENRSRNKEVKLLKGKFGLKPLFKGFHNVHRSYSSKV